MPQRPGAVHRRDNSKIAPAVVRPQLGENGAPRMPIQRSTCFGCQRLRRASKEEGEVDNMRRICAGNQFRFISGRDSGSTDISGPFGELEATRTYTAIVLDNFSCALYRKRRNAGYRRRRHAHQRVLRPWPARGRLRATMLPVSRSRSSARRDAGAYGSFPRCLAHRRRQWPAPVFASNTASHASECRFDSDFGVALSWPNRRLP